MKKIVATILLAAALNACGGGGGGGSSSANTPPSTTAEPDRNPGTTPDPDPAPNLPGLVPDPMPPQNTGTTIDGSGTDAVYVDICGENENWNRNTDLCEPRSQPLSTTPCLRIVDQEGNIVTEWNHNLCGQQIIRETAGGANATGTAISRSTDETIQRTGTYNIVSLGYGTAQRFLRATAENNDETLYIAAATTRLDGMNRIIGLANNGIIAASSRAPTSSETVCPPDSTATSGPKCIRVDLARGRDARQHAGGDGVYFATSSSWAVAKLAGYAAILREAFSLILGRDLVSSIQDGADQDTNIFSLSQALTMGNFGGIQYDSATENFDGTTTVEETMMGWTSLALTGRRITFAPNVAKTLQLAAFGNVGGSLPSHAPQSAGIALRWHGFQAGAIAERNAFLGKPSHATIGGTDGRWTWLGWSNSKTIDRWTLSLGIEGGIGKANAKDSPIVEDYGTILTSAWNAKARYDGDNWHTSFNLHQPPRTERVRIRLRHGEGTVGTRPGRELRLTTRLGIGPWLLSAGYIHEPGHDERAQRRRGIRLDYRVQW